MTLSDEAQDQYNSIKSLIDDYVERNQDFAHELEWANKIMEEVNAHFLDVKNNEESYRTLYNQVCITINNRIIKTKDIIQGTESVLDTAFLASQVQKTFLSCPLNLMPIDESFLGAGVYAIYYFGQHPLYAPISLQNSGPNKNMPIYIGKAVFPGTRKNNVTEDDKNVPVLYKRLREHCESIEAASTLSINDFACRYYVAKSNEYWMVQLLESTLIERFRPIWNQLIDGFGNHDPGSGRANQKKSIWDSIHPGRKWADKLQNNKNILEIYQDIITFYNKK